MVKPINIPIKATGAEETKEKIKGVGQAAEQFGQKVKDAQGKGAAKTDEATGKLSAMDKVLGGLKGQVMGFVGAWLGFNTVLSWITSYIDKLKQAQQLQGELYKGALQLMDVGQALEIQTGTKGRQQYWTEQAIALQEAGGLQSPKVAQQMLVSMDIAFAKQGGIKNKDVLKLGKELAPFVGAAGLGPDEVSKIFEFAGTAGVKPSPEGYKEYFAKLMAGFTASKATNFGQFMTALQKGGTAYMTQGGTLTEAISTFSAARAVTASEELAASLVEQVARMSSGGYEKPRQAIEKALHVRWEQLPMDRRMAALLEHVQRIPEGKRAQKLTEEGFPAELTTGLGKMVSAEAIETMGATRQKIAGADANSIEAMTKAYMDSLLGKSRVEEAKRTGLVAREGPQYAGWAERLNTAKKQLEILQAKGKDLWTMPDEYEADYMALESLLKDYDRYIKELPEGKKRRQVEKARKGLSKYFWYAGHFGGTLHAFKNYNVQAGYEYTRALEALRAMPEGQQPEPQAAPLPEPQAAPLPEPQAAPEQPQTAPEPEMQPQAAPEPQTGGGKMGLSPPPQPVVNNYYSYPHYDHSMHYYPSTGEIERGPRFRQV